jgi:acetylornithine deacetylase/succinyl-diaminopimelate desuccinylase-like protein
MIRTDTSSSDVPATLACDSALASRIARAVDALQDDAVSLLSDLVREPSLLGEQSDAQAIMADTWYGPEATGIHTVDESVSLRSLRDVTCVLALFVAGWCGLEALS